ncbi:MAG: hypothetical protein N3E44_03200 [Candidatus Bathyarchaeota archaeon]|nr:hypothetical protein [Candidatus Bathyarchaeota archaeon]
MDSADVGVENNFGILAEAFKGEVVFNGNANWRVLVDGDSEKIRGGLKDAYTRLALLEDIYSITVGRRMQVYLLKTEV